MIQYNATSIYIIGGLQNGSNSEKTWIIDPSNNFQIRQGPSLNVGRISHSCGKMKISGKTFLVVAGGFGLNGCLDSVELLNPLTDHGWIIGKAKNFIL